MRATGGVHDVLQMAAFGKKGRMAVHVQVLVRPDALEGAVEACFRETTTIGLRTHLVHGRALSRRFAEVAVEGHEVRVKLAERPGGMTAKAECDHLLAHDGHDARARLRRAAETLAATAMSDRERLTEILAGMEAVAIAVSGGIDSLTLATVAHRVPGLAARMHHATSPAVPAEATQRTRALAAREGWWLDVFDAGEFADPAYRANPVDRCFFCKTSLYGAVAARTTGTILSGTNLDDLGEYRPGLRAAAGHGVRHPFVEAGIDKRRVRALAAGIGLGELAELPASPCLSSRIETGIRIEAPVLAMVHEAETLVGRSLPARTVRCRVRAGRRRDRIGPDGARCSGRGDPSRPRGRGHRTRAGARGWRAPCRSRPTATAAPSWAGRHERRRDRARQRAGRADRVRARRCSAPASRWRRSRPYSTARWCRCC